MERNGIEIQNERKMKEICIWIRNGIKKEWWGAEKRVGNEKEVGKKDEFTEVSRTKASLLSLFTSRQQIPAVACGDKSLSLFLLAVLVQFLASDLDSHPDPCKMRSDGFRTEELQC